ncbi:MAG TPA: response regulator [Steroidobacteraceae bacterium]|jgi:CheY-like chemotaxis protein|nr:response regulator [Steroidobacteraceae bacterium]
MQLAPAAIDVPILMPHRVMGRRVLVVDDNEDAADALAQLLRVSGHEVDVAYNGMCALARVRARRPDIVLCDLGLPELSGFDFARAIRHEHADHIRLVAISGYDRPEDIRRSLEAGFDAHLAKPAQSADIESLFVRFSGS